MTKPHLELTNVQMAFDTPTGPFIALENVDLKIRKGEFVSLIGHSGCGKSTVLNIVAGLLQATRGGCVLDGHEVNTPGPERAVVFQNHSLMPWLTVYENVELAVQQVFRKTMSKAERRDWILHNLKLVNMDHALDKRPGEISGGMAQRVGIARALAMKPSVLLMDEPFGALDALTRAHLQDSLMEIQQDLNSTVIMITHDVDEAVLLSDRIVMMTNGPAAKVGEELYIDLPRPRNRVALADNPEYVHYRQAVLSFLYEKQSFPNKQRPSQDESEGDTPGNEQTQPSGTVPVRSAPSGRTTEAQVAEEIT
ncbi:ABC transporter ATP-binding protein [Marinobacter sp.]|uniref:ABC transporter ATP-binding protein n=1 Tax=Marinobacter sp. TaxID=50741 RepID=UPI0034A25110